MECGLITTATRRFLLLVVGWTVMTSAAAVVADESAVDYGRDIKPILRERCYACHGALKQEAGLRLDTAEFARRGSAEHPVLVADKPAESPLIQRVTSSNLEERMPPEGHPLTAEQIERLKKWIAAGAGGPAGETPEQDPREHWAFRRPLRAPLPATARTAWVRNEIDAFIAAEQERAGLLPRRPAAPEVLLRRVYLDLVGVPPTPEELHAFLVDPSDTAYEQVVERLLNSPLYGQRWGRHWMDVWRYSDWFGRRMVPDVWNSAPQIWRWRDWIVRSLNRDLGYDDMLRAMLAADEVWPEDDEAAVATGYLIRNWYALNPNLWMRDNVEHTAKAMLGLTFNCAHCHDHKYDPISQQDYFRLRAAFETIGVRQDRVAGEAEPGPFQEYQYSVLRKVVRTGMVRIYDKNPEAPTWFYTGGDERNRVKERGSIPPGVPAVLGGSFDLRPLDLPPVAWYPGARRSIQDTELAERRAAVAKAEADRSAAHSAQAELIAQHQRQLELAEAEFARLRDSVQATPQSTALAGRQSLVLHAETGRRVLSNSLTDLKSLPAGSAIRFQLRIVKDAHVNFQLAKDNVKGLTAGMVAFESGRIVSYQPGGFTEFQAGKYDWAANQRQFDVRFVLEPAADRCLLTVRSVADDKTLVDAVPVALNGWNPVGDPTKAISFDARTGSVAAVDQLVIEAPGESGTASAPDKSAVPMLVALYACDFESPRFADGKDCIGIGGWVASPFGQAPATSVVTTVIDAPALEEGRQKVQVARRALESVQLKVQAADAQWSAAQRQLESVEARIAADRARYEGAATPSAPLVQQAARAERVAALASAEANLLTKRQALVVAEALPATDANRAKAIQTATQQITDAQTALDKLLAAQAKSPEPQDYTPLSPVYSTKSSGRRRALANWIASTDNPLTARVAVNHIWLRHFHSPLVATVFDFGRNGAKPSHPELLDWLAVELMESNWSMKRLHTLIVTSATYRQASGGEAETHLAAAATAAATDPNATDPENRLLWRMNVGRLESELVRDGLLSVTGQLDVRLGGQELENSESLTTRRRSLYYSCFPETGGKSPIGELFDGADPAECYRRTRSITPQQALVLTNSPLVHELSGGLAVRIGSELGTGEQATPTAFVDAAFERILARRPSVRERELCLEFLERQARIIGTEQAAEAVARARESLVRALFNHNDFVTVR